MPGVHVWLIDLWVGTAREHLGTEFGLRSHDGLIGRELILTPLFSGFKIHLNNF